MIERLTALVTRADGLPDLEEPAPDAELLAWVHELGEPAGKGGAPWPH